jgi:hypothetical protein
MLTKFWETVGAKLAERWAAVAVPTLLFWTGGLLAMVRGGGADSVQQAAAWLNQQTGVVQTAALVAALAVAAASGLLVQQLTLPVLRVLEGYWPRWSTPLRRRLIRRWSARRESLQQAWDKLAAKVHETSASAEDRRNYVRLDQELRRYPADSDRLMPTWVGNILRASESRPLDKYGLDAVKCWPHLWLLLPDETRQELIAARKALDTAATALLWGPLFLVWTPWTLWSIPVGLAVAAAAQLWWVPDRAQVFGDLVEAAFDLHRSALYTALRWPLPSDPRAERGIGAQLTEYLWRGSDTSSPKFTS